MRKTFYTIWLRVDRALPGFEYPQYHDEWLGLTANLRLSCAGKEAWIASRALAESFLGACRPAFDRRYGEEGWEARISECVDKFLQPREIERLERDTETVRARLDTGNLAPNRRAF